MSKLLDLLKKSAVPEVQRMGFGIPTKKAESLPLILLVRLPSLDKVLAESVIADGAHALVVEVPRLAGNEAALRELVDLNPEVPVGFLIQEPEMDDCANLGSTGADFVVLEVDKTPCALLRAEDITRILLVDDTQSDASLRAIGRLPVDAVLVTIEVTRKGAVTIKHTLEMQRILELVRKPSIITAPEGLLPDDLETLRDAGFLGVLFDLSKPGVQESISLYRQKLKNMPVRRRVNRESISPVLPPPRAARQELPERHEEEEMGEEDELSLF